MVNLDDAIDKLRWANHHFDILREQIQAFEQSDRHTISVEVDPPSGTYTFYIHGLEVPDPDWGLRIGDCLHNARTALDYVMVRLWALVTGQSPSDIGHIQFPVYDDPKKFASAVGEMRKELGFSGYLATIEQLQPFNAWNPSIWGYGVDPATGQFKTPASLPSALGRLSLLDNIDKHRVVHATWNGIRFGHWFTLNKDAPPDYVGSGRTTFGDQLEDGAKVGEWTFQTPLPGDWKPTEVQMKGYFPLQVAFPDPSPVKGVLEILPWCLSAIDAVITIFAPVFDQEDPPLPVTAVRTVRG